MYAVTRGVAEGGWGLLGFCLIIPARLPAGRFRTWLKVFFAFVRQKQMRRFSNSSVLNETGQICGVAFARQPLNRRRCSCPFSGEKKTPSASLPASLDLQTTSVFHVNIDVRPFSGGNGTNREMGQQL